MLKKSLSLLLFLILPLACNAQQFHAIVVTDTDAFQIGKSVRNDQKRIKSQFKTIAKHIGIPFQIYLFESKNTDPMEILNKIGKIEIAPDDLVLFYFSGHGFRLSAFTENPWPMLALENFPYSLRYSHVIKELIRKKPQFILALSDCCNSFIDKMDLIPVPLSKGNQPKEIPGHYEELFLNQTGLIMASSSEPGEYSYCYPQGGIFTTSFVRHLRREAKSYNEPSWEAIFHRTSMEVLHLETPQYIVIDDLEEAYELFSNYMGPPLVYW